MTLRCPVYARIALGCAIPALVIVGCGGDPFSAPAVQDASAAAETEGAVTGAPADAVDDGSTEAKAVDGDPLPAVDDAAVDVAGDVLEEQPAPADAPADAAVDVTGDVLEEQPAVLPCDSAYGDASPGGPCCVHVWATPTMGAVLCTSNGSRWCWQTGMPCSAPGSSCVVEQGAIYCAP